MIDLNIKKIPFSAEADSRLRILKSRTGLARNFLCRIGFCLSLEEAGSPVLLNDVSAGNEIDRYTLLGQQAEAYRGLLIVWLKKNDLPIQKSLDDYMVAHMNRGVEILASRIKTLVDLSTLLFENDLMGSKK